MSKPDPRKIEYLKVSELISDPRNPKAHATAEVRASIGRFGFVEPIVLDGRTGYIISGHGRTEVLAQMERAGENPPSGVKVDEDGHWTVPVVTGWESRTDLDAGAALIALNRTTELGGWVDDDLLNLLDELGDMDDGLVGVGFTEQDIESLKLLGDAVLGDDDEMNAVEHDENEDVSPSLTYTYRVLIECDSEEHQAEVLEIARENNWNAMATMM